MKKKLLLFFVCFLANINTTYSMEPIKRVAKSAKKKSRRARQTAAAIAQHIGAVILGEEPLDLALGNLEDLFTRNPNETLSHSESFATETTDEKINYFETLNADIILDILTNYTAVNTIQEAIQSIRSLSHVNKSFNILLNSDDFSYNLINHLSQQFGLAPFDIVLRLDTIGARRIKRTQRKIFFDIPNDLLHATTQEEYAAIQETFSDMIKMGFIQTTNGTYNYLAVTVDANGNTGLHHVIEALIQTQDPLQKKILRHMFYVLIKLGAPATIPNKDFITPINLIDRIDDETLKQQLNDYIQKCSDVEITTQIINF